MSAVSECARVPNDAPVEGLALARRARNGSSNSSDLRVAERVYGRRRRSVETLGPIDSETKHTA